MNSLKVPDAGLLLEGCSGEDAVLPPQAFALTLSSDVIADMVKAVRNSENIQLALGSIPTLHYGSKSHRIAHPEDDVPFDLYLTKPFESTRKAERLPHTSTLFSKVKLPGKSRLTNGTNDTNSTGKQRGSSKSSGSGLDSDIETLQKGLAAREADRDRAQMIERAPNAKRKTKNGLLPGYSSNIKSLSTSPGHKSNASPSSTPVLSATQLVMERAKESRFELVHELAVRDQTYDYLSTKWQGKPEDFSSALKKVADYNTGPKNWSMRKTHWKELDVWKYEYGTQEERQKAIDNAIRQYDKQRLSASEPEWQKLLPKEERGKGKCLSRLQATLAKGPAQPAPKIKVQKADDSSTSKDDGESVSSERSRASGEAMSRSNSSSLASKVKKAPAPEPSVKKATPTVSKPLPVKKASPIKNKIAAVKANGARVLSQANIENSDSSGDEAPLARQQKNNQNHTSKEPSSTAPRAPSSSQVRAQPAKRPRDDEDSSSSSGTPLSKRLKQKQPLLSSKLKERQPDSSQRSRNGTSSTVKNKNTSPTKSSPLASSPPTNASDMEMDEAPVVKKRKVDIDSRNVQAKRRAVETVSTAVVDKANKFKQYYQKYEALHYEIASLDNPPRDKVAHLLDMRKGLESMKQEIYRACSPV